MKTILAILATILAFSHRAQADTIYTYTGNPFTSYCTECSIDGSFTLAVTLPANLPFSYVLPLQGNFTGGFSFPANPLIEPIAQIGVATDANGNISEWYINFYLRGGTYMTSLNVPGYQFLDIVTQSYTSQEDFLSTVGENHNIPGTWTVTQTGIPIAPTPEPATILLACTGLLTLFFYLKRGWAGGPHLISRPARERGCPMSRL